MKKLLRSSLIESLYWLLVLLLLLILAAINPLRSEALTGVVAISEIYPAPLIDEKEWVEIYNSTTDSVDMTGWWLSDELSSPSLVYQFSETDAALAPGEFRQIVLTTNKLNNSGDGVRLFDSAGVQRSRLFFTTSVTGQSQQRTSLALENSVLTIPTPSEDNSEYPLWSSGTITPTPVPTVSPTPAPSGSPTPSVLPITYTTPTPTPTPTPTLPASPTPNPSAMLIAGHISVSEIFACPTDGQPEWIELLNTGDAITVTDWRITDHSGNYRLLTGILPTQGVAVFNWSGSLLNNSGDTFVVSSDQGSILDSVSYGSCSAGKSLVLDDTDTWVVAPPTPGVINQSVSTSPSPTPASSASATLANTATSDVQNTTSLPTGAVAAKTNSRAPVPWLDPRRVKLESETLTPPSTPDLRVEPQILGATTIAPSSGKPWELFFVIMGGLFFVLAGLLPPYAPTFEKATRVDIGLAASATVG